MFTSWTFGSGERIPLTFEILDNCCSDVIIGEDIMYKYNVFEDHAASIITLQSESELYELAPFGFIEKKWQRNCDGIVNRIKVKGPNGI